MLPEIENRVALLKRVLIFNELEDEELASVAERLKTEHFPAGEVIFQQEDLADRMYILNRGEVYVARDVDGGSETTLTVLSKGDSFGTDALYKKRPRLATVGAHRDSHLFYLDTADFQWLRDSFPQIDPYLLAFSKTHDAVRRLNLSWLGEGETISLIARRHPIRMIGEILITALVVFFVLTLVLGANTLLSPERTITFIALGLCGFVTLIGFVIGIWSFLDWRNDYFFITNARVVWRERILLRSASRQEIPLRTIQSLDIQTSSVVARMIHVGDLIIKTFNSQMMLTDVYYPERMKSMINGFLRKVAAIKRKEELAAIRQTIRGRLGYPTEHIQSEIPEDIPSAETKRPVRFSLFKTRLVDDNNTITYRKHWLIFLGKAWLPSSLLLLITLLSPLTLPHIIQGNAVIRISATLLFLSIFFWWLYQYEDWRNDIYRITKDRIIDREKSPLGAESFRSAPIRSIQSVGHEIPSTIGLIVNVGNVRINVGDETLSFDGVHNPALVHQDISRRMETFQAQLEENRRKDEHNRMATWLEIYHEETGSDGSLPDHIPDFY